MRTIQIARYCRFFCLRPEYANFNPRSTDSFAARYNLDFVRKYPLARSNIFLRRWRRLVPRFTRGMSAPFSGAGFPAVYAAAGKDFGSLIARMFQVQPLR